MAISDTQKVDFLWKKIGFGKVKTDVNSLKNATNESIASPLLLRGSEVWAESSSIPAVMPGSSSGVVTVYPTSSPVETTEDITASTDRTWKTSLSDWIPPEIASTYLIKVYIYDSGDAANAASSGTQIFGAGSGNNDEWFFDYQAGVLHFIGTNLPSGISGKSIYISGARYTGTKGVSTPGGSESFSSINVTGITTSAGGAELSSIRIGIAASTEIDTTAGNLTLDSAGGTTTVDDNLVVTGTIDVDGLAELDDVNVSSAATIATATITTGTVANLTATQTAELQFGGSKKFETIGTGVSISNGISTVATIAGPSQITIDPAAVGDNTGIVVIAGNLQVDGTQTVVNSTTMTVDDKNLELGTGAANDAAADGGGITIVSGDGNKTFQFEATGDNLGSSENLNIASGKDYKIDNTSVLNATTLGSGVVNSSLTSVGTLTSLDVNGHTELDNLNVSGVSTFAGAIGFTNGADIAGLADLDDVNVSGASTFTGAIDANGDLDVDGHTELDDVNVSGVSTFTGAIDANGDLDVDGHTELDTLNVSGVSTFVGNIDANAATFSSAAVEDLTDNRVVIAGSGGELEDSANLTFDGSTLTVVGLADLDDVNVSGAATVTGVLDVNGGADISGGETTLSSATISDLTDNRVLIAGTSGAVEDSANLTFDGSTLNVVGLADLDDVNVSSAATIATAVITSATASSLTMAGVAVTAILDEDNMASDRADALVTQQSVKAYVDSQLTAQDLDIAADSGTGAVDLDSQSLTLSGTANEIETSASGQTITIGLPDDVTIGNNLTVTTATNLSGMLNVTGISTFASAVDVNAAINISGLSELADVSVSSAATITGALDVNGGADISGGETTLSSATISDLTDNRVLIAGTSGAVEDSANLTFDGSTLNVVGLADLDDVNVSSAATIATAVVTNATITSLTMAGVAVTAILDEDDMSSDRADAIPTQQSVKAYVGSQLTAQDLDFQGDTGGTLSVDLDSQSLIIAGTSNEIETSGSGQTLTIGLPDAVQITTSLDVPTVEATNLKAKDGTTAITITDATGAVECAANLTVGGNLYVNGSTTQVNTNQTTIEDQLLELGMVDGSAPSSDLDKDIGVIFNYYTTSAKKAAVYWDDSTSRIVVSSDVSESSGVLTNSASGALEVGSLYVNGCTGSAVEVIGCDSSTVVITNATIDGGSF